MKKLISLLLCLMLTVTLTTPALAATNFSVRDALSAQTAALQLMQVCAFGSEYGDPHNLVRWEQPLRIYVGGQPAAADIRALTDFLTDLAVHVPMMPNATIVTRRAEANITIFYVPLQEMDKYVTDYVEGNWGMFRVWWLGHQMTRAEIAIATDVTTQQARIHLLKEELVGALGLCNDHDDYHDSILYQPWTTTQELSPVDWLMLNMLYHPDVSPGMTWQKFQQVTNKRIQDR